MIPLKLTLKNFLSYRQATLDFRGLHTACICGANGAGKSSLLEAITWVIWGKTRAVSDDDLVYHGEKMVRVDFEFISNDQYYRIIRNRSKGKNSSLDFHIKNEDDQFIVLTSKAIKDTQKDIISTLKLDYDTFVNSAYLRQGRADEFMLRKPNERKQILADLLKLDHYEELADQAKDFARQFKGQADQLASTLEPIEKQLETFLNVEDEKEILSKKIEFLQELQSQDQEKLINLQTSQNQRETWSNQVKLQQNQLEKLLEYSQELTKEIEDIKQQLLQLEQLLNQGEQIKADYEKLIDLREKEEQLSHQFQEQQKLQQTKIKLEQELLQQENQIKLQLSKIQTNLEHLEKQKQELSNSLNRQDEINHNLLKLNNYRQQLEELDQIQHQISPLLQQRQILINEIKNAETKLNLKLEKLRYDSEKLLIEIKKVPETRKLFLSIEEQLEQLKNKRNYQQRVLEKGQDKGSSKEQLKEQHKNLEKQLNELHQKLILLQQPDVVCPLCEQELDEHYRHKVINKTEEQHQESQHQFWVISEQLTLCEKELKNLRDEYSKINQELACYDSLQQKYVNLENQLMRTEEIYDELAKIEEEMQELERNLTLENYANDLKFELQQLEVKIKELNYNEQTHALVRSQEKSLRWAEFEQRKIEESLRRLDKINQDQPYLLEQFTHLKNQLEQLYENSEIKQQIQEINLKIEGLGYNFNEHEKLRQYLRQSHNLQLNYEKLKQSKDHYPLLQNNLKQREEKLNKCLGEQTTIKTNLENLRQQMNQYNDYGLEIEQLNLKIKQNNQELNNLFSQKGQLEQTLIHLEKLREQYQENQTKLTEVNQKYRIYQELSLAFGKNGIQAVMIENILPQFEAETNQILSRLTANQLHVQFLTQKATKSSQSKNKETKLIDTLEIIIADANGTRSYETYSGGEAFRINFAIRLALAKLLAQRAGTALQLLIIDEGFGTQDDDGCQKLIAAINSISSDFACILSVTHLAQFKEAFETRIYINKTEEGSQILVLQ